MKLLSKIIGLITLVSLTLQCSKDENVSNQPINNYNISISLQKVHKRVFQNVSFDSMMAIHLEDFALYRPIYCVMADKAEIYTIDISERLIHRFDMDYQRKSCTHFLFGNGKGQGPGELNDQFPCLQVYKNILYIADPLNGVIQRYSTEGRLLDAIRKQPTGLPIDYVPEQFIILSENKIIIKPRGMISSDDMFIESDSTGLVTKTFGNYIDINSKENIYQAGFFIHCADSNSFYFIWSNLGFVGYMQKDKWKFAKATIDGIRKPEIIQKDILEGFIATRLKPSIIILDGTSDGRFVILKTWDKTDNNVYYDVYEYKNFTYLYSIENKPRARYFDYIGGILTCIDDYTLRTYRINLDHNGEADLPETQTGMKGGGTR